MAPHAEANSSHAHGSTDSIDANGAGDPFHGARHSRVSPPDLPPHKARSFLSAPKVLPFPTAATATSPRRTAVSSYEESSVRRQSSNPSGLVQTDVEPSCSTTTSRRYSSPTRGKTSPLRVLGCASRGPSSPSRWSRNSRGPADRGGSDRERAERHRKEEALRTYAERAKAKVDEALRIALEKQRLLSATEAVGAESSARTAPPPPTTTTTTEHHSFFWRLLRNVAHVLHRAVGVSEVAEEASHVGLIQPVGFLDPLDDPDFIRRVGARMQDRKVLKTFYLFDEDGSGSVSTDELEHVVAILHPFPTPETIREMVEALDIDNDGEVDIFEFCVHLQKKTEGIERHDVEAEMDMAFSIFNLDSDERVSIYELRRWLTHSGIGVPLSDEEFLMFAHEMGFRDGVESVPYKDLRGHPCWAT
ncbi:hypothetical protein AB1Y20_019628 [Prymnesium parvum]|uniref:EF-hand domain-containing protein n=1 Tax=Prymnesium parvum TaxID=97485 RepID=A0AB34JSD8_PRYPA